MMEDKDECVSTIGKRWFFWLSDAKEGNDVFEAKELDRRVSFDHFPPSSVIAVECHSFQNMRKQNRGHLAMVFKHMRWRLFSFGN